MGLETRYTIARFGVPSVATAGGIAAVAVRRRRPQSESGRARRQLPARSAALIERSDVLLLDEPTDHLDAESVKVDRAPENMRRPCTGSGSASAASRVSHDEANVDDAVGPMARALL